ncbi:hypothetical protein FRC06_000895, partial [Ceratobasidium sp. 370]
MSYPSPCRIVSASNPRLSLSLLMHGRGEGTPVVCRDKYAPESTFLVRPGPGGFTIQGCVSKWHVGANPDNLQEYNYPFVTSKPFAWYIESAGNGTVKILVPNMNDCVQLPDDAEEGSQ